MDDLIEWLRAQLDVDEAAGGADAFPPPGYANADRQARGVRMLAEVEAKRLRIEHYLEVRRLADPVKDRHQAYVLAEGVARKSLMFDTLPYADRPGYKPEWRP